MIDNSLPASGSLNTMNPTTNPTNEADDIETGTLYVLRSLNRTRLENSFHRLFDAFFYLRAAP